MAAPAWQAAGAAVAGRDVLPRTLAAAGLALLAMLMLIVAPLALFSSAGGDGGQITRADEIPTGLVPVFNEAARVYQVNAYLLASIAEQESTFGAGPGWRTVNSAGCVGLMQMCMGGRGGDSWGPTKHAYRRGQRPATYTFKTERHPDVLDSFDNVMAAAVHLRGKVGGRPIPDLDALAHRALCGYYGACADGIAGNYAADVLEHARAWQRQAAASPSPPTPPLGQRSPLLWPVRGPVTSPFCERRAWEACHPGIDIGIPRGTPVLAAAAGRVSLVQSTSGSGGYGTFTCLQHTGALSTCYAHQERILVASGQFVTRAQPIGLSGCTGRCFGPHLHFEVRLNDRAICPALYLGPTPTSMCAA